jgi:uncharacterized protein YbjT (DUF2867 family)
LNGSAAIREFVRRREPVRALVRSAAKAASLGTPATVEVVEGDMLRQETLGAALDGVDHVLMISAADAQLADTQRAFIDAAKRARVKHIVKFSGLGAALDTPFRFNRMHAEIERYFDRHRVACDGSDPGSVGARRGRRAGARRRSGQGPC